MNTRKAQLRQVADQYLAALEQARFDLIPFAPGATLRAPLAPGGVHVPLYGIADIHAHWWVPLAPALSGVQTKVEDYFVNDKEDSIIIKAEITLPAANITLRVADLFILNESGQIIAQENHFDASPLRNPA